MKDRNLNKLVSAALMAAMTCVVTIVIAIPSPIGGFIHPGDGFVILSGIILGPIFGGLAAGLGSMLADIILGFSAYAAATFVIKCLGAGITAVIYRILRKNKAPKIFPVLAASILSGIVITLGYFIFEGTLLGLGFTTAAMNIPFNLIQNCFGILISVILYPLLSRIPQIRGFIAG